MDKEYRAEILTLTSEVRLSDKTLFFNRSLVHSSARDQFRNYHQCGFISEDTILWVQILPYFLKFCWISRKFFKTVSLPLTPISEIFGSPWDLIFHRNTTRRGSHYRRGSLPRRGFLHSRGFLTSTGRYEHQGLMGLSSSFGRKLRGIRASGGF